jgi:hypothetical protein
MIEAIRKCNICTNGGILVAILIAASFASAQVACLTHSHCEGADCFEHREESRGYEAEHECGVEPGSSCDEHQDHDIHHHSHDGNTHPKRRFIAPADETAFADAASSETPAFELTSFLPVIDGSPPFERYGLDFAERAPPLS